MRALNRHYTAVHKKKKHPASKCRVARCPVCHHHKYMGGNHAGRTKKKYSEEWKFGNFDEFLNLSPEEVAYIEKQWTKNIKNS